MFVVIIWKVPVLQSSRLHGINGVKKKETVKVEDHNEVNSIKVVMIEMKKLQMKYAQLMLNRELMVIYNACV